MKKYIAVLGVLAGVILCVTGCQKSENYQLVEESKGKTLPIYEMDDEELQKESPLKTLHDVYQSGYIAEEWTADEIKAPGGIVCNEDEIIVSDKKEDCILKMDYEGNVIEKAGITGSGDGEFLSPSAVAVYNDELYVLDQGNNRVQVLDEDMNFVREIKLKDTKSSDPNYTPTMMTVNEEGVYVTGMSLENPVVDRYSTDGLEEIGSNFIGAIDVYEGQVYLVNSMVRYYDESNDSFGAVTSGPEWLLTINGNKLEKKCELPYGFNISNFLLSENGITCVSGSGASVYRLDWNGEYVETIARIEDLQGEDALQISVNDQEEYYIVMPKAGKIVKCYKNGSK